MYKKIKNPIFSDCRSDLSTFNCLFSYHGYDIIDMSDSEFTIGLEIESSKAPTFFDITEAKAVETTHKDSMGYFIASEDCTVAVEYVSHIFSPKQAKEAVAQLYNEINIVRGFEVGNHFHIGSFLDDAYLLSLVLMILRERLIGISGRDPFDERYSEFLPYDIINNENELIELLDLLINAYPDDYNYIRPCTYNDTCEVRFFGTTDNREIAMLRIDLIEALVYLSNSIDLSFWVEDLAIDLNNGYDDEYNKERLNELIEALELCISSYKMDKVLSIINEIETLQ